jgi:hypothetical protein
MPASRIATICGLEPYVVRKRTADLRNAGLVYSTVFPKEREQRWFALFAEVTR